MGKKDCGQGGIDLKLLTQIPQNGKGAGSDDMQVNVFYLGDLVSCDV